MECPYCGEKIKDDAKKQESVAKLFNIIYHRECINTEYIRSEDLCEIRYDKNVFNIYCPLCWYKWDPVSAPKYNWFVNILFFIFIFVIFIPFPTWFFILDGWWVCKCRNCWNRKFIKNDNLYDYNEWIKKRKEFIKCLLICIVIHLSIVSIVIFIARVRWRI